MSQPSPTLVRSAASRRFVIAPYPLDVNGQRHEPEVSACPVSLDAPKACRVELHHRRPRRTGPCHPLLVLTCEVHGEVFTVYPPAFGPYLREPMLAVTSEGLVRGLTSAAPLASSVASCGTQAAACFEGTYFDAALDVVAGRIWPREASDYTCPRRVTQVRRLREALAWLGLDPAVSGREREMRAEVLDVELVLLTEQARALERDASLLAMGSAVKCVLDRLPGRPCLLDRLLGSGRAAGRWGPSARWDGTRGELRRVQFRGSGTHPLSPPD